MVVLFCGLIDVVVHELAFDFVHAPEPQIHHVVAHRQRAVDESRRAQSEVVVSVTQDLSVHAVVCVRHPAAQTVAEPRVAFQEEEPLQGLDRQSLRVVLQTRSQAQFQVLDSQFGREMVDISGVAAGAELAGRHGRVYYVGRRQRDENVHGLVQIHPGFGLLLRASGLFELLKMSFKLFLGHNAAAFGRSARGLVVVDLDPQNVHGVLVVTRDVHVAHVQFAHLAYELIEQGLRIELNYALFVGGVAPHDAVGPVHEPLHVDLRQLRRVQALRIQL